jgi:L-lactate dehydrogenase complex protein LldG
MSVSNMTTAREDILNKLRAATAQTPFDDVPTQETQPRLPVTKIGEGDLRKRFIAEVERVRGVVHSAEDDADAKRILINLLQQKQTKRLTMWDTLPLQIDEDIRALGIERMRGQMRELADAEVGITGAACAIAATGTLVLEMGEGRSRAASLLPPVHVALVRAHQLVPRLEDYIAQQRAKGLTAFSQGSNVVLLTGASRTADIEMNVVYGVHGPLELHVILIEA